MIRLGFLPSATLKVGENLAEMGEGLPINGVGPFGEQIMGGLFERRVSQVVRETRQALDSRGIGVSRVLNTQSPGLACAIARKRASSLARRATRAWSIARQPP